MSRSLHFAPVAPPPPSTDLGGVPVKSLFLDAFGPGQETASGEEAFRLTAGDLPTLRTLRQLQERGYDRHAPARTPAQELADAARRETIDALSDVIDAIEQHGELRFWLE